MKVCKIWLLTCLFLLMSAGVVLAAGPMTKKDAESLAVGCVPPESELLKTEEEENFFEFRFYSKNSQEWYKVSVDKKKGAVLTFDSARTLNQGGKTVILTASEVEGILTDELEEAQVLSGRLTESAGISRYEITFDAESFYGIYVIHPETGMILERKIIMGSRPEAPAEEGQSADSGQIPAAGLETSSIYISTEKVRKAVLDKVPGAEILECKLDDEDGRAVYKGQLQKGCFSYRFSVDAITGTTVRWDMTVD